MTQIVSQFKIISCLHSLVHINIIKYSHRLIYTALQMLFQLAH